MRGVLNAAAQLTRFKCGPHAMRTSTSTCGAFTHELKHLTRLGAHCTDAMMNEPRDSCTLPVPQELQSATAKRGGRLPVPSQRGDRRSL